MGRGNGEPICGTRLYVNVVGAYNVKIEKSLALQITQISLDFFYTCAVFILDPSHQVYTPLIQEVKKFYPF